MSATVEERESRTSILLTRNPKFQPLNSQVFSSLELAEEADAHLSLLNNPPSWPDILLPTKGTKPAGTQPSTGLLSQAPSV